MGASGRFGGATSTPQPAPPRSISKGGHPRAPISLIRRLWRGARQRDGNDGARSLGRGPNRPHPGLPVDPHPEGSPSTARTVASTPSNTRRSSNPARERFAHRGRAQAQARYSISGFGPPPTRPKGWGLVARNLKIFTPNSSTASRSSSFHPADPQLPPRGLRTP